MKLIELMSQKGRQPLVETYIRQVSESVDEELVRIFAQYNKLSGNLKEDVDLIAGMIHEAEVDVDFDPLDYMVKKKKVVDPSEDCVLTFSTGNDKLQKLKITAFDLPAGYTCPFAKTCKTFFHKKGGKFKDTGQSIKRMGDTQCYAASGEHKPAVRKMRWRNFDLLKKLKTSDDMKHLILRSMDAHEDKKPRIRVLRIHSSGDFFNQTYFDAWMKVAVERPDVLFYAYTKSLKYWNRRKRQIPPNLRLIASRGGEDDAMIDKEQFRNAVIVHDEGELMRSNLRLDITDFLAAMGDEDFALMLHGVQEKGPKAKQSWANQKYLSKLAQEKEIDPDVFERTLQTYLKAAKELASAKASERKAVIKKQRKAALARRAAAQKNRPKRVK